MRKVTTLEVKVLVNALIQELRLPDGVLNPAELNAAQQLLNYYQNLLGE